MIVAQALGQPERLVGILVIINDTEPVVSAFQQARDFTLRSGIALQVPEYRGTRRSIDVMAQSVIGMSIEAHSQNSKARIASGDHCCFSFFLSPTPLSKFSGATD